MDQHLMGKGETWPATPAIALDQVDDSGIPLIRVSPEQPKKVERVEIFYALNNTCPRSRFWRGINQVKNDKTSWTGEAPFLDPQDVIFTFASVTYPGGVKMSSGMLRVPVSGLAKANPSL